MSLEFHPAIVDYADEKQNVMRYWLKKEALALKRFDQYTYEHSKNVSKYAIELGRIVDLKNTELDALRISGMFHDIGKTQISLSILNKNGILDEDEYKRMKDHPQLGYNYMRKHIPSLDRGILNGILEHHERIDGTGYPFGLKGCEISLFGRIIAICDVYDALNTDRPYHKALPKERIFEYMHNDGLFDKDLLESFVRYSVAV